MLIGFMALFVSRAGWLFFELLFWPLVMVYLSTRAERAFKSWLDTMATQLASSRGLQDPPLAAATVQLPFENNGASNNNINGGGGANNNERGILSAMYHSCLMYLRVTQMYIYNMLIHDKRGPREYLMVLQQVLVMTLLNTLVAGWLGAVIALSTGAVLMIRAVILHIISLRG